MSILTLSVYYEDTDSGGVVYYANYLKFIERGRTEVLRELGFGQGRLNEHLGVIFAERSLNAEYHSPARLDEVLSVHTELEKCQGASLVFHHKVANKKQNQVLFEAKVRVACLRFSDFQPCALPKVIVEKING